MISDGLHDPTGSWAPFPPLWAALVILGQHLHHERVLAFNTAMYCH